jgi:hypothetical protein
VNARRKCEGTGAVLIIRLMGLVESRRTMKIAAIMGIILVVVIAMLIWLVNSFITWLLDNKEEDEYI